MGFLVMNIPKLMRNYLDSLFNPHILLYIQKKHHFDITIKKIIPYLFNFFIIVSKNESNWKNTFDKAGTHN
jgi:hypothetical protein